MKDGDRATIGVFPSPQSLVRLHPSMGQHLKASFGQQCTCQFGLVSTRVTVWYDALVPNARVDMSSTLLERLHLSSISSNVNARVVANTIRCSPVIGILCNPLWDGQNSTLRDSKQLPVLEKLIQFAKDEGVFCYVFRLTDVDFQKSIVKAFFKDANVWKKGTFPLPDVIYDQLISRRVELQADFADRRAKLSQLYKAKIFNDGFFDKLQVNEWLMEDARVRAHLPETIKYAKPADAAAFMGRHQSTFLKPIHGSLGLGIIRFVKHIDGSIHFDVKRQNKAPLRGKATSTLEALKAFRKRLSNKPYILQQGISLARYQDRPFDLRVLVQKDGTGEWKRTKMFARIAKDGEFTSNLTAGGDALPVSNVLESIFAGKEKRQKILSQIRKVSKLTAEVVEHVSKKSVGELGIDLGIDDNGGVWIIEVNSKPWKAPTTEKGRTDLVDLAFIRPIQYAKHLAEKE